MTRLQNDSKLKKFIFLILGNDLHMIAPTASLCHEHRQARNSCREKRRGRDLGQTGNKGDTLGSYQTENQMSETHNYCPNSKKK